MKGSWPIKRSLAVLVSAFIAGPAQAQIGAVVSNWAVPSPNSSFDLHRSRALSDVTSPIVFVGVTPCRIVDTRGPAGTFGAPALPTSSPRNFPLPTGPCGGLPSAPRAYSLNITVTNTLGPGFISLYPQGGSAPLVSTLNYVAGQTIANAAIVPAGTAGGITAVAGVSGTDLIIDIDGYYGDTLGNTNNVFNLTNDSILLAIQGVNLSTTCGGPCGVEGVTHSGNAVAGFAQAASGIEYGVYGNEFSVTDGSAGVYGVDFTGDPGGVDHCAGVLGSSTGHYGVLGRSRDAGFAVAGFSVNTSGVAVAGGYLGFSNSQGVFYFNGLSGTGTKNFIEPHPTDATKLIKYVSIEGREAGVYFRGRGQAHQGLASIDVPEDFRMVAAEEGLSIQVTPIGEMASVAVTQIDLNRIAIRTSRDVEFFYTVNGVRKAYPTWNPIQENRKEFMPAGPDARLPAYLSANETQRLIDNGTYNADGTVNMGTAERVGWVKAWSDRKAQEQAAAQEAQKVAGAKQ